MSLEQLAASRPLLCSRIENGVHGPQATNPCNLVLVARLGRLPLSAASERGEWLLGYYP